MMMGVVLVAAIQVAVGAETLLQHRAQLQIGTQKIRLDRVVVVAQAAGPAKFADPAWALAFAQSASAVLGKQVINVDADALSITY